MRLKTPDFTPEGIVGLAAAGLTDLVILFGLDVSNEWKTAMVGLITTVVVAAFLIHSALIRKGRAAIMAAQVSGGSVEPEGYVVPD